MTHRKQFQRWIAWFPHGFAKAPFKMYYCYVTLVFLKVCCEYSDEACFGYHGTQIVRSQGRRLLIGPYGITHPLLADNLLA